MVSLFMSSCIKRISEADHATAIILFNDNERRTAEAVVHRMVKRAVELEGTVTGEHGVGLIKRDYLEHEVGKSAVDAMRRVSTLNNPLYTIRPMYHCDS